MEKMRKKDSATHMFYFETYADKTLLLSTLKKFMNDNGLCYYKYITYPVVDKKRLLKRSKNCGVLQCDKRYGKTIISQAFATDGVYMDVMRPAEVPTVLCQLKVYVLAEHHGIPRESFVCSKTPFGFKGRRTRNEAQFICPYLKALSLYENYNKPNCYPHLPGAKRICEFKYMLKRSKIMI
jgi:hypothetical protein